MPTQGQRNSLPGHRPSGSSAPAYPLAADRIATSSRGVIRRKPLAPIDANDLHAKLVAVHGDDDEVQWISPRVWRRTREMLDPELIDASLRDSRADPVHLCTRTRGHRRRPSRSRPSDARLTSRDIARPNARTNGRVPTTAAAHDVGEQRHVERPECRRRGLDQRAAVWAGRNRWLMDDNDDVRKATSVELSSCAFTQKNCRVSSGIAVSNASTKVLP